jgi:hypothetical protein
VSTLGVSTLGVSTLGVSTLGVSTLGVSTLGVSAPAILVGQLLDRPAEPVPSRPQNGWRPMFEQLGLGHLGPADGHDLSAVQDLTTADLGMPLPRKDEVPLPWPRGGPPARSWWAGAGRRRRAGVGAVDGHHIHRRHRRHAAADRRARSRRGPRTRGRSAPGQRLTSDLTRRGGIK